MGKTVPAYRIALEFEIDRWRGFRKALASEADREALDELMDLCRIFASESSNATNPVIFEPMVMSIMLGHQKQLRKLENKLSSDKPIGEPNKEPQR